MNKLTGLKIVGLNSSVNTCCKNDFTDGNPKLNSNKLNLIKIWQNPPMSKIVDLLF